MKKWRWWQLAYALCSLVYMGWMINVSAFEFDRINDQYRRIAGQLDDDRLRKAALAELNRECRRESAARNAGDETECSSWPPARVEAAEGQLEERLTRARARAAVKLALFYAVFAIFFLLAPPLLIYLLIVGIIKIFLDIKIVR
ncbi:MAG: hypothetical protein LC633_02975 [Desulfobulbaceae bacterium]|nr:hypothetical protein [Desulfobulbaceae bacterium]